MEMQMTTVAIFEWGSTKGIREPHQKIAFSMPIYLPSHAFFQDIISKSVKHSRAPGTIPGLRGCEAEMFQVTDRGQRGVNPALSL